MGTRSRIIIRRKHDVVYLWHHLDGYLEGVGADICTAMKKLLERYTVLELQSMVEEIEQGSKTFDRTEIYEVIEGSVKVEFDDSDDIQYTYEINVYDGYVGVSLNDDYMVTLPLEMIKAGYAFTDVVRQNQS